MEEEGRRRDERKRRMRTKRRCRRGGRGVRGRERRSPTLVRNTPPSSAQRTKDKNLPLINNHKGKLHSPGHNMLYIQGWLWRLPFITTISKCMSKRYLPWGTSLFELRPFYKFGGQLSLKSMTEASGAAVEETCRHTEGKYIIWQVEKAGDDCRQITGWRFFSFPVLSHEDITCPLTDLV